MATTNLMRYMALATDYDGTLAQDGVVADSTVAALERLKASGRRLILVTGRELPGLLRTFPQHGLFDRIVAENGGLLYDPSTCQETALAPAPPPEFIAALHRNQVSPLSVGKVIVATWEPHEKAVLESIRELGLELQVIFNKGAVMVLPAGVNKTSGLQAALSQLKLSSHNVVGIGDAENDHAFLRACECSAAVANALDTVKDTADLVTRAAHGLGVEELIGAMLDNDLADAESRLQRRALRVGADAQETPVGVSPYEGMMLLSGASRSGKSTLATLLVEQLADSGYQFCILDPEGDYEDFESAASLGTAERAPRVEEVLSLLDTPSQNASVNLIGVPLADRPQYFLTLMTHLLDMRARLGRPHWIVLDEAHHMLPRENQLSPRLPSGLHGLLLVTLNPSSLAVETARQVKVLWVVGEQPAQAVASLCSAMDVAVPPVPSANHPRGEAWEWRLTSPVLPFSVDAPHSMRRRHKRKYASGDLGSEESFYFRGPAGKLNLRARNLIQFMDMADGIDSDTWQYHLRQGDYSAWMRDVIKDPALAEEAARIERLRDPDRARRMLRQSIEKRYTLPA